jgi:hypothetical protein
MGTCDNITNTRHHGYTDLAYEIEQFDVYVFSSGEWLTPLHINDPTGMNPYYPPNTKISY